MPTSHTIESQLLSLANTVSRHDEQIGTISRSIHELTSLVKAQGEHLHGAITEQAREAAKAGRIPIPLILSFIATAAILIGGLLSWTAAKDHAVEQMVISQKSLREAEFKHIREIIDLKLQIRK